MGLPPPSTAGATAVLGSHLSQMQQRQVMQMAGIAEGEPVEFDVVLDERGRARAVRVTGPDGAQVKGAPRADPTPSFD